MHTPVAPAPAVIRSRSTCDESAQAWTGTPPPAELDRASPPLIATEDVPRCPVCASERFETFAVGFDYELLTCRNPWRFVRCGGEGCGHVRLHPRPAVSALGAIYPPTYYAYDYAGRINPVAVRAKHLLDRMKFRSILGALPRRPKSYLDAGCGDGRFLRLMEGVGVERARCFGLELDARVVERLAADGFPVYCERVEETRRIPDGSLDLATMFHVIEHVDDPGAVVGRVASWLAPGGVFALETPNLDSWDARLFERTYWGGYHIPRHWHLFTPATLRRMLESHGLRVVGLRYQTGHSFWMYSVHHRLRYGTPARRGIARWFNPVGGGGLPFLAAFTAFDKARAALGFKTSAMLMLAQKP